MSAQEKPLPPPDRAPHLILAHSGPHSPVNALAFSADSSALFAGGFDKQVRRYEFAKGKVAQVSALRVPIGPGNAGVVNALAVSPDGKWVAVAGRAPIRGEVWTGSDDGIGEDFRRLPPLLRRDTGVVYLFDPANPNGGKVIRGQQSEVRALAFASPAPAAGPVLVTAGLEWNEQGEFFGTVRVFNAATGEEIAARKDLPATAIPPGIAAWASGEKKDGLHVVVAWDSNDRQAGRLLVWDSPGKNEQEWLKDSPYNSALAVRHGKAGGVAEIMTGGFDVDKKAGAITVRDSHGAEKSRAVITTSDPREFALPVGVAALDVKDAGECIAVLARVRVVIGGTVQWRHELRLLTPTAERTVVLEGISADRKAVLTASPDGRLIAVAGFTDNRVEVFDAAALAAGKPTVEKLAGASAGFSRVAFLVGEKLWLGSAADTVEKGGVVLDLTAKARVATPRGAREEVKVDAPAGAAPRILEPDPVKKLPWRVVFAVGGVESSVALPEGERATAAAFLPGKPAWDVGQGALVAVAHLHERSQSVLVTLFDAATGKPLLQLGGPTLPVRSLAFSATRPLLAAAGDDGTVAVWSLKNAGRALPAVEGLLVTDRGGAVVVASVQPGSPAAGKLKADDEIESVADAKGVQKPVATPLDFVLAVRALKPGDNAQIKVKNKPAMAVPVGAAIGFRHPLFTLWVDPVAKEGKHDWVGWTSAGPYDANSEAAEERIGWLTATGDPARPVMFAGAKQYRKLFYKRDFIRLLVEKADFNEAVALLPQPRPPRLIATPKGDTQERNGRLITRAKLEAVEIALSDPDNVLDLDRAVLAWRITGADGVGEWKREPFSGGRAVLDLAQHPWNRGEQRVQVKLLKNADAAAPPVDELTLAVDFVPPPPVLTVQIDGKPPQPGVEFMTESDVVQITAVVDAKGNPEGAGVILSWTGGKPIALTRKPDGTFAPEKVKLQAEGTTAFLLTATNSGKGVTPDLESHSVEVRVRKLPPKKVAPPTIQLAVLTPADMRTTPDEPYVIRSPGVTLTATVKSENPFTVFDWKIGDADWEVGKLDLKTSSQTRELTLTPDKPLVVQVRAQSKNSPVAADRVQIVYEPLPEASLKAPSALVTVPELNLSGGLKVGGKKPFRLLVLVTSGRTGQVRAFESTFNRDLTEWESRVTLFPGENQFGYSVKYDEERKELRRTGLAEVRYVRPPAIAGAAPVDAGTGGVGTLALAVVSPADAAPSELWVDGSRVGFRAGAKPLKLLGVPVWLVEAHGVAVGSAGQRLKNLAVAVRNAEHASPAVMIPVLGQPPKPVSPPALLLTHGGGSISAEQPIGPVGEDRFSFGMKVTTETQLSRLEVWHAAGGDPVGEEVGKLTPAGAAAVPGGFELKAEPVLRLRPGVNRVKVLASNGGQVVERSFTVSYTPPAVRVVIDSIREPGGKPIPVAAGSAGELRVSTPVVEVAGRVLWDFEDEPIAQDRNLSVVFIANGVAHLPVSVPPARGGKERTFAGRVYLNALGNTDPNGPGLTRVRVDLRSGGRPAPVPQQGIEQAGFTVTSDKPFRRQRLHVLVVGVEVPPPQQKELIQRIVRAVGGTIPADRPNFREGRFDRKDFEFAYLYSPRLDYTKAGDLNTLLHDVRVDIERRSKRPDEGWVNDVVVIYYQGGDWVDEKTGRWLLHSAVTLSGAAGRNQADYAIRLDNLPQIPGMPVAVVNVASSDNPDGRMVIDLPLLRYGWADPDAVNALLPEISKAIQSERTVKDISQRVNDGLKGLPKPPMRTALLPAEVLARVFGSKAP